MTYMYIIIGKAEYLFMLDYITKINQVRMYVLMAILNLFQKPIVELQ